MFAESMDTYRAKADIIAKAELYRKTAIACCDQSGASETRIAAAQAADELLYIKGVDASFTLFEEGNTCLLYTSIWGRGDAVSPSSTNRPVISGPTGCWPSIACLS